MAMGLDVGHNQNRDVMTYFHMRQSVTPASSAYDSMPHSPLQVSYKVVINQVMDGGFESQVAFFVQQEEVTLHLSKYFQT